MARRPVTGGGLLCQTNERVLRVETVYEVEQGDVRVRVVRDHAPFDFPDEPLVARFTKNSASVVTGDGAGFDEIVIARAWRHYEDAGMLVRWLSMVHGAVGEVVCGPNWRSDGYVVVASAGWIAATGLGRDNAASTVRECVVKLVEWLEGNVFRWVAERRVSGLTLRIYEQPGPRVTTERFAEWEHIDQCGGYMGLAEAKAAADQALRSV